MKSTKSERTLVSYAEIYNIDLSSCPIKAFDPALIVLSFRGSIAHGTYRPNSDENSIDDIDLVAVTMPSLKSLLTVSQHNSGLGENLMTGTDIKHNEWDIVQYTLQHLFSLLKQGNPNVLSMLWTNAHVFESAYWHKVKENRQLFASQNIYKAFISYASAQGQRMTRTEHGGYMGAKRKALVEKHGYDTKNASHLIRLLRMGSEMLVTGEMSVDRSNIDAELLLAIKNGAYSLTDFMLIAEHEFAAIESALEHSVLPEQVNGDAIDELLCQISVDYYKNTGEI